MKLRMRATMLFFFVGAVAALIGDHGHVVSDTTAYLEPSHRVPFVWSSPVWFPILVGTATVTLAELRLHLSAVRATVTWRQGLAGVAAVEGIYALTALVHGRPAAPATMLIGTLAVITWCVLGDRFALVCAGAAAVVGPAIEAALVAAGVFRYAPVAHSLFGIPSWLPALYFAFGVVAALLGEIAACWPTAQFTAEAEAGLADATDSTLSQVEPITGTGPVPRAIAVSRPPQPR